MDTREQLQELLSKYVEDTFIFILTVRDFCDEQQKWTLQRETELDNMRDIKDRADQVSPKFDFHSENKAKALKKCLRSGVSHVKSKVTSGSKYKELEKELGAVLKDTLEGLEKLDHFLDAVEKLSVTSLFVFTEQIFLPKGESPASVRSVITAARLASPLLIHFKRNAETFFLPSLNNLDVLAFQLDKYIRITEQICEMISCAWSQVRDCERTGKRRWKKGEPLKVKLNLSDNSLHMQNSIKKLVQLSKIRMDQHTRLTFIFQEHALRFIDVFSQCRSRMEQFLSDLEENVVQLDRMKMGASISTVASHSVGIAGGVLSIAGLALAPVTAGVSLALTLTGVGLGVTSSVNSVITGITEAAVNSHHGKNAQNIFQRYMDDVRKILDCLEQASSREPDVKGLAAVDIITAGKLVFRLSGKIVSLVDKALQIEEGIVTATKIGLSNAKSAQNITKHTTKMAKIGRLAKGTPLALSKFARGGFITLNALFIGLDVFFICKESKSLAKGSKSVKSQLIRSRASLWKSELEAWQKIHDSLCIGIWRFRKSQEVLEQPFLL